MLVLTWARGVHGFTLDPEIGEFMLTHPNMRIPEDTSEFAINASNERFWEPPVQRYVDECVWPAGTARAARTSTCAGSPRWWPRCIASSMRGGVFMYPQRHQGPGKPGRLRLLYEANPMALLVEQAGGRASTGRARMLDVAPQDLHQRVPVILGSRNEVERIERYHRAHDAGEDRAYESPLFRDRASCSAPA